MGEVTREELGAMTDQELLAYEREHHGDPYMTLLKAKGMQRIALQFWHVGAAQTKADSEAQEAVRRLHHELFPCDSAVLESIGWPRLGTRPVAVCGPRSQSATPAGWTTTANARRPA